MSKSDREISPTVIPKEFLDICQELCSAIDSEIVSIEEVRQFLEDKRQMNDHKSKPKQRGNPNFRAKWNRPTKSMRLPDDFEAILFLIARKLDLGEITENDLHEWLGE